jgi:predicted  nucleic acid-binding Zn-ribbon protein
LSDSANTFIAQERARYSNELKKAVSEHRKAMGELQTQKENVNKLQSELQQLRSSAKAATGKSHAHQLDEIKGRFRALEEKYNAAQAEIGEKRSLESNLATAQAERETAVSNLSTYKTKITAMTQEIEHCKATLSQTRAAEAQAKAQVVELRGQSQPSIDDLCRKLSQAEERSKYAESGLAQMKASAEKTISEDQEKHRRQCEALQHRLDEAQSELQAKSEEADETRAFVERTVTQQQTVWQKSHAELESKASDYKAKLEEKTRLLESAGKEQDTLREEIARLQAEIEEHLRTETEHLSREDIGQVAIEDLRSELETARNEVSSLRAVQQRYLQEKDERTIRETKAKSTVDDLRKDHEAAKALIASLQASEKQNKHDEAERNDRANKKEKELHDTRNERDAVQTALEGLQARFNEHQALCANEIGDSRRAVPQAEQEERSLTDTTVPPPSKPQQLAVIKQRKRADRNTNTIVSSEVGRVSAAARSTRSSVLSERAQVVIPAQNVMSPMTSQPDEMLDVASSQPGRRPESQLVSSMQEYQASNKSTMHDHTKPTQVFTASLDFSGEPLVASRDAAALRAPTFGPSHSPPAPNFKIYEDLEDSANDGPDKEIAVRANFTFRKPSPLPNSGSKRLSRTTSDRSFEGHSASSHGALRTSENAGGIVSSRARNTPEVSKYGFGSSPEFMNPPSSMTKRRYSGNAPGMPGNHELLATRRSMTPFPDPSVAKKAGGNKCVATRDGQQNTDLEPPTKKRNVAQTFTKSTTERSSDGSFLGRSSQSVSDLPRAGDLNAGRATSQMPSSHMRTSAGTSRVTRNRKGTKGENRRRKHTRSNTDRFCR